MTENITFPELFLAGGSVGGYGCHGNDSVKVMGAGMPFFLFVL